MSKGDFEPTVPSGSSITLQMQRNHQRFVKQLTRLSRRHGVAVKSVGGVIVVADPSEIGDLVYVGDISSCDLLPLGGAQLNIHSDDLNVSL
jgi:hypothetical protein